MQTQLEELHIDWYDRRAVAKEESTLHWENMATIATALSQYGDALTTVEMISAELQCKEWERYMRTLFEELAAVPGKIENDNIPLYTSWIKWWADKSKSLQAKVAERENQRSRSEAEEQIPVSSPEPTTQGSAQRGTSADVTDPTNKQQRSSETEAPQPPAYDPIGGDCSCTR